MSSRFRRSSSEPVSPTGKNCGTDEECHCCSAIRRARRVTLFDPLPEWGSPLTLGMQLVNLSHSDDGAILRANLSDEWARMFAQLPLLGGGLVMTRNEAAILGRRMTFPALAMTTQETKGASAEGGLWLNFQALGTARAVHLRREAGHIFGVEFSDKAGHTVHRFTATPATDLDALFDWMRLHQACASQQSRPSVTEGEEPVGKPAKIYRPSDAGAIISVLAACCEQGLAVRATVRTDVVVQRAAFALDSLQLLDGWWFASGGDVGLHFHPEQFHRVEIIEHPGGPDSSLSLRCHTDAYEPGLILECGDECQSAAWSHLLDTLA